MTVFQSNKWSRSAFPDLNSDKDMEHMEKEELEKKCLTEAQKLSKYTFVGLKAQTKVEEEDLKQLLQEVIDDPVNKSQEAILRLRENLYNFAFIGRRYYSLLNMMMKIASHLECVNSAKNNNSTFKTDEIVYDTMKEVGESLKVLMKNYDDLKEQVNAVDKNISALDNYGIHVGDENFLEHLKKRNAEEEEILSTLFNVLDIANRHSGGNKEISDFI